MAKSVTVADSMAREHPLTDIVAGRSWAYRGYKIVQINSVGYPDFDILKDGNAVASDWTLAAAMQAVDEREDGR